MTDFDLGQPAPDADEEPAEKEDHASEEPEPEPENHTSSAKADQQAGERSPGVSETATRGEPTERDPTETGPAFPYSEVDQNPLYAREETWREFKMQLDVELTPALREEGILDDELREIHDIVLEIAIDNLDEVPERLKEKRRKL